MPAKTISLSDLAKAVDEALLKTLGKGRPGGPIIVGRVVKDLDPNTNALSMAKQVVGEVQPRLAGLRATPTALPGPGGTTIGFVLRAPIQK